MRGGRSQPRFGPPQKCSTSKRVNSFDIEKIELLTMRSGSPRHAPKPYRDLLFAFPPDRGPFPPKISIFRFFGFWADFQDFRDFGLLGVGGRNISGSAKCFLRPVLEYACQKTPAASIWGDSAHKRRSSAGLMSGCQIADLWAKPCWR